MTHAQLWIGTSWKMNKRLAEARDFAERLAAASVHPGIQPFVIPPFTAVREVKAILAETPVKVGAQTMHWDDGGAWTGEISAPMLVDCGVDLVEIGHSERRTHFGESDETVGLKVTAALRHRLVPLVCIGETADDKAAGRTSAVLARQVEAALAPVRAMRTDVPVLLAYEPVWAIGAGGTPASPDHAEARQAEIGAVARSVIGYRPPCLYGGSVTLDNCIEFIGRPHVDGLFIGRAAWEVEGYLAILERCARSL